METSCPGDRVIVGSYDRFLFGFECSTSGAEQEPSLVRRFSYPAHKGPVKCVASAAPYLASGGADDLIHLYDLSAGTDLGFLINPGRGAVSAVAFHAQSQQYPSHLFSGSADGTIAIWQASGEWVCLKTLQGHKKGINSLAVHPSGRLALSTSPDCTLRLWNLMKGKIAHISKLGAAAEQAVFSPSGDAYGLLQGSEVLLYETGREEPSCRLAHQRRPNCLAFSDDGSIITGAEDGSLRLWDTRVGGEQVATVKSAHGARIRAVERLRGDAKEAATASTDGSIRIWDLRKLLAAGSSANPLSEATTTARLTCMTTARVGEPLRRATFATPASVPSKSAAANLPGAKEAHASKAPTVSKKQRKSAIAAHGVAHDGVVEFGDSDGGAKQRKKKKKTKAQKPGAKSHAATPKTGLSAVHVLGGRIGKPTGAART